MDGLLIDSEPLWQEAEKKIFSTVGISLTTEDCLGTMGLRIDEVVSYWFERFPWEGKSKEAVADEVVEELISLVRIKGEPKEGVDYIFNFFTERGIDLSIASSSSSKIINVVTDKLGLRDSLNVIHSAEHETHGKPHPAVYLSTAKLLGVSPETCLTFEDSPNGLRSAKAAGMKCVFIPEPEFKSQGPLLGADATLSSLLEFDEDLFSSF